MRYGSLLVAAAVAVAVPGAVVAQTAPSPAPVPRAGAPGRPMMTMPRAALDSAYALGGAYHAIGRAEQAGATGRYLDSARTHYRSALDRHGRNDDRGASAEARLASSLARVAVDERPANAPNGPRDIPAPPTPRPVQGRMPGMPGPGGMWRGMPGMGGMPGMDGMPFGDGMMMRARHARFGMHGGFDAAHLAELLKVETGAEARQLAQSAVDANGAAQRAALAGNTAEAARQTRIGDDLMAAVHDLAMLNHPELGRSMMPMPRMFGGGDMMPH
jgi:hypothetical protein